ncbi:aminoacylase-1 isoform X1 [Ciona intestinalis]
MPADILAVQKFREYIRIKTVHPKPDYKSAIAFLDNYGKELGLENQHIEIYDENHTVVILTWKGKNSDLPSILLNSHTDVVPVYQEHWKHNAFAAIKDDNGDIYGRGTQDMKCVGVQYLEAIRELKKQGVQLERDVHLSFVPDEEIGGGNGMCLLLKTEEFKSLNIGVALDEGLACDDDCYRAYCGERSPWWLRVVCKGNPGHGSRFIENTAAEKLNFMITKFLQFRSEQKSQLDENHSCMQLGDVTTVNLTQVQGGIAMNIVPAELSATFDVRVPPSVDLQKFETNLQTWCNEAGSDVTIEYIQKNTDQSVTSKENNPWWEAFSLAVSKSGVKLKSEIFSGATDSRFLRKEGYQAIGFSPMRNTPILLHDHNEFLNEKIFLEGIQVYCDVITALGNV